MKTLITFLLLLPIVSFSQSEENKKDSVIQLSPIFPGGTVAMNKFIRDNFQYSKTAITKDEQGTILVEFVVYFDGVIRDVKVIKNVSPTLDAEAIRVMESMPKWTPGKQNGKKVNVRYTVPIITTLELSKGQKRREKRKNR
jgi:TonB family protein